MERAPRHAPLEQFCKLLATAKQFFAIAFRYPKLHAPETAAGSEPLEPKAILSRLPKTALALLQSWVIRCTLCSKKTANLAISLMSISQLSMEP